MDQETDLKDKAKQFMSMGLGKLGDPGTIFPRCFRWTFHPINHDDTRWWFQKIKVDYKEKVMEIKVYDDVDGQVHGWLEDVMYDAASRQAQLRHYDGCGRLMYTVDFIGLEVMTHNIQYDYATSDVLTHTLKLSFKRSKRTNKLHIN